MGQFDRETNAALAQVEFEALSSTPGGEFAEIIGDLLKLVGGGGPLGVAGGVSNLLLKVRKLAGASYGDNLIYVITAVRNDLADLYQKHEELRGRIDSLNTNPQFVEAISALALRAMHTSVKNRLARLARIVANGVKENDLEPDSLDDMMRAAVELNAADLTLLGEIVEMQSALLSEKSLSRPVNERMNELQKLWADYWNKNWQRHAARNGIKVLTSLTRLRAAGLIGDGPDRSSPYSVASTCYWLLDDGMKFYERLQEIAS